MTAHIQKRVVRALCVQTVMSCWHHSYTTGAPHALSHKNESVMTIKRRSPTESPRSTTPTFGISVRQPGHFVHFQRKYLKQSHSVHMMVIIPCDVDSKFTKKQNGTIPYSAYPMFPHFVEMCMQRLSITCFDATIVAGSIGFSCCSPQPCRCFARPCAP